MFLHSSLKMTLTSSGCTGESVNKSFRTEWSRTHEILCVLPLFAFRLRLLELFGVREEQSTPLFC